MLPAPGAMTTCLHALGRDATKASTSPRRLRAYRSARWADGVVIKAGPAPGFGYWVVIQHSNGDVSIYGHMETFSVTVGEHVKAGEIIAHEGSMGYSTGPHLHFEVHRGGFDGPPIDPSRGCGRAASRFRR